MGPNDLVTGNTGNSFECFFYPPTQGKREIVIVEEGGKKWCLPIWEKLHLVLHNERKEEKINERRGLTQERGEVSERPVVPGLGGWAGATGVNKLKLEGGGWEVRGLTWKRWQCSPHLHSGPEALGSGGSRGKWRKRAMERGEQGPQRPGSQEGAGSSALCAGTSSGERDSDRELKPQTTLLRLSEVTAAHVFNAVSQVSSQQMACFPFHRQREIRLEGTCRRPHPTSSLHTCHMQ